LALMRHARFSGLSRLAVILSGRPGELASVHAASLAALGVPLLPWTDDRPGCERLLSEAAIIVDGLSGTGLKGALHGELASLVAKANGTVQGGASIASIDIPSGLSDSYMAGDPLVSAAWTLSVEPRKACLYHPAAREFCGEIEAIEGVFPADAAIAPRAWLLESKDLDTLAPLPPDSAYKGSRGRVAVFAGSVGTSGAAVISSRACLAAGAGLVTLYASAEVFPVVAPMLEAVMVRPEDIASFDAGRCDALLVGPGWGRSQKRLRELEILLGFGLPAVLDADAIYLFKELVDSGFRPEVPLVLTPHPGEFAALSGRPAESALASPAKILEDCAKRFNAVIVLKSHVTWIVSPEGELAVWEGRESGLATAGSGDVLAGIAAGLLARSAASGACDAFSSARAAVIAHGLAGRAARAARGWFEAGAIAEEAAKILGSASSDLP
jgi:NAD(P)H-hydrate epimerase